MQHYDVAAWHPWLLIAAGGAAIIFIGIILQIASSSSAFAGVSSFATRRDPWNGAPRMGDTVPSASLQLRGAPRIESVTPTGA